MLDPSKRNDVLEQLPRHLAERSRIYGAGNPRDESSSPPFDANGCKHPVVYWTHHALRTDENPALDVARLLACATESPLLVYQGLSETYRFASDRHHCFALQGARDLHDQMDRMGIRYALHVDRKGCREPNLRHIANLASILVTDEFPGEPTQAWLEKLRSTIAAPIVTVDTSCVVPMLLVGKAYDRAFVYRESTASLYQKRVARNWQQISVSTKRYDGPLPFEPISLQSVRLEELIAMCDIDHTIGPVSETVGGTSAGYQRWNAFVKKGLSQYANRRNDPIKLAASRMSAYLHYGMVSPFRLAREAHAVGAEKFLDELLIWRELAYSFCFYRDDFETLSAVPEWARDTLQKHESDLRESLWGWEELARGKTSDELWNACQRSLIKHGELHNNVRMTWGKSLLGWTKNAGEALRLLIDLNHRFALDGRDPASYGGILWCLGQFDRPFTPEQSVIGTVRSRTTSEHLQRLDLNKFQSIVDRPVYRATPSIAVIGAGLGGLFCARVLSDHGLNVKVFEKSGGLGGRAATRRMEKSLRFDHGAQFFTCRDPRLAKYVDSWLNAGIVSPWSGRLVEVESPGQFREKPNCHRLVGVPTMNAIGKHIGRDLQVNFGMKVTNVLRVGSKYELMAESKEALTNLESAGLFDIVLWNCPAPQTSLMVPEECTWLAMAKQTKMKPCWSTMVAFETRWETGFDGATLNQGPTAWAARDSSKPDRPQELDCWVVHSSHSWANANLTSDRDWVAQFLIQELEKQVGISCPEILFRQSHRWLYADVETPCPTGDCAWDSKLLLGACGDWFARKNIEGAMLSGMALAGRVLCTLALQDDLQDWFELTAAPAPVTTFGL
jgi:photolyase PhrII